MHVNPRNFQLANLTLFIIPPLRISSARVAETVHQDVRHRRVPRGLGLHICSCWDLDLARPQHRRLLAAHLCAALGLWVLLGVVFSRTADLGKHSIFTSLVGGARYQLDAAGSMGPALPSILPEKRSRGHLDRQCGAGCVDLCGSFHAGHEYQHPRQHRSHLGATTWGTVCNDADTHSPAAADGHHRFGCS